MKKVIFIIAFLVFSLNVFSQNKINTDDLVGYWAPSDNTTHLFFWKDANNELQMQEIIADSGELIDVIVLKVNENSVFVGTEFKPNEWLVESDYTFINKITLKCVVTGDANETVYYTKIK